MRELLREPAKEFPQFEAALCLLPVVPPEEAIKLLRDRALHLTGKVAQMETELSHMAGLDLARRVAGWTNSCRRCSPGRSSLRYSRWRTSIGWR